MERDESGRTEWVVSDNVERRRFEIDLGDSVAIAEYNLPNGMIMFTHTEVPPEHEGKGIGSALIRAGLAAARERGLTTSVDAASAEPLRQLGHDLRPPVLVRLRRAACGRRWPSG